MEYKFNIYENLSAFNDSMELESGYSVADLEFKHGNDDILIEIRVCGDVRVFFNDEIYKTPSRFPDELKRLFHEGKAGEDKRVEIGNNNWFELFVYKNKTYQHGWGDVVDKSWDTDFEMISFLMDIANEYVQSEYSSE